MNSFIVAVVCLTVFHAQAADPRLTVADVERVTGFRGVRLVPLGPAGEPFGGLNFADRQGRLLFVVKFFRDEEYHKAKSSKVQLPSTTVSNFHRDVMGIGDEAFDAPARPPFLALYVRKGSTAFLLLSFVRDPSATTGRTARVPQAQLRKLAKIIASRT